jgi:hypothetical protein
MDTPEMQAPDAFPDPDGVLNGAIAVPLPATEGKGYRVGELDAHADEPSAITDRIQALANTALSVVEDVMTGDHTRGQGTRLQAASTILDRVAPRLGVAGSTGGVTISANQLAVIVQGVQGIEASQPLPPTV